MTACNMLSSCCQVLQNVGMFNDILVVVVKYKMKYEYLYKSNFKVNVYIYLQLAQEELQCEELQELPMR